MNKFIRRWMPEDEIYLRRNWELTPVLEIARTLGRTEKAVEQRAYKLFGTTLDRDPKPGRIKGRRVKLGRGDERATRENGV